MEGSTEGCMSETISKERAEAAKNDAGLPLFNLKRVLAATNNFNVANKLGEGGFGPVHKAKDITDLGSLKEADKTYTFKQELYSMPAQSGHTIFRTYVPSVLNWQSKPYVS
ncbi:unnamed protein product [Prunus armeniaca]